MKDKAEIGILGGTGLYEVLKDSRQIDIKTPYGNPSTMISLGEMSNKKIAFIPRHGIKHQYPPHKIPYLANFWAFKELGVKRIISSCAVGSLKPEIKRGSFVICDQYIDWTKERPDTFFNGPKTIHIGSADPYCLSLRKIAVDSASKLNIDVHEKGTVVVINGPRFSTRAESQFFARQNFDIINMTQYPEVALARELGMCYVNISLVTDYDAGLVDNKEIKAVSSQDVVKVFNENNNKVKKLIFEIINSLPDKLNCQCEKFVKEGEL